MDSNLNNLGKIYVYHFTYDGDPVNPSNRSYTFDELLEAAHSTQNSNEIILEDFTATEVVMSLAIGLTENLDMEEREVFSKEIANILQGKLSGESDWN